MLHVEISKPKKGPASAAPQAKLKENPSFTDPDNGETKHVVEWVPEGGRGLSGEGEKSV
jgi:hypothetical protein